MSEEKDADYIVDEKEVDSMNAITEERTAYKRLNFSTLNFMGKKTVKDSIEDITPIKWSEEVLSGEKQCIILKGLRNQ